MQQIIEFVSGIRTNAQIGSFDETAVKQAIVFKLLFLLGWDIFNPDEVIPNLSGAMQYADYALKVKNKDKAAVKVLRPKAVLDEHQEKFFENASKSGVELALLTNGISWWFYLPQDKGAALQNRFAALDFQKQREAEIAESLTAFLQKDAIAKGAAVKQAVEILKKHRQQSAREAIPAAWFKILTGPDDGLVRLIGDTVEKICGVPAEKDAIVQFLSESLAATALPAAAEVQPPPEKKALPKEKSVPKAKEAAPPAEKNGPKGYDGLPIRSFDLKGKNHRVKSWEELLVKLCEALKSDYDRDIESLQWHSVGRKYYFSKIQHELRFPAPIGQTDIFVETYLSPNETVKVALSVLQEFGFAASDLKIA